MATSVVANNKISTNGLSLVKENHANIKVAGIRYVMDSYIIPFQRPYYIVVTRVDKARISHKAAVSVSRVYIKPRGCTTPITHRHALDRSSSDKTQWLIVIQC